MSNLLRRNIKASFFLFLLSAPVITRAQTPPANDDCSGAITIIPQGGGFVCNSSVAGSGLGATMSATPTGADCTSGAPLNDVWYKFTATASTATVRLTNVSPTYTGGDMVYYAYSATVHKGSCNSLDTAGCGLAFQIVGGNPTDAEVWVDLNNLVVGSTYYIQVACEGAYDATFTPVSGGSSINFNLCVTVPGPPVNDNCAGAVAIMGNGIITGSAQEATQSLPRCSTLPTEPAYDIWYSFTPTSSGNVTINATALDWMDQAILQVFTGACGALTSISCTQASATIAATAGTTYYLRVYSALATPGIMFTINLGGVPLPVTGTQLSGAIVNGGVLLNWQTLSERNNRGFRVQRSDDGKTFRNAGWISSTAPDGNSSQALHYRFADPEPVSETVYYRLQQTDIDGKTTLSNTLRLSASTTPEAFDLMVSPNPVNGTLVVSIPAGRGGGATLSLVSITGTTVKTMPVTGNETHIDMSAYAPGIYMLRYRDAWRSQAIKIVKQRP